jgi:hypothetical protein
MKYRFSIFVFVFFVFFILLSAPASCCSADLEDLKTDNLEDFPGANEGCQLRQHFNNSIVAYTLNHISQDSDLIITGTVVQNTLFWARYEGYNYSHADTVIEVDEYLKGSSLPHIHVTTLGSIEDETCIMNGGLNPILIPGDQVLLFLFEDENNANSYYSPNYYVIAGFNQGHLIKVDDRYVGIHERFNVTVDDVKKSIDAKESLGDKISFIAEQLKPIPKYIFSLQFLRELFSVFKSIPGYLFSNYFSR